MKITKAVRETVVAIVSDIEAYDASTVQISRDGDVSAVGTTAQNSQAAIGMRLFVARVTDMVTLDGHRREGW